jgi:hypothetical protein
MATPSSLLVALPSSSKRISDLVDALLQINAVSFISSMNDDMLFSGEGGRVEDTLEKLAHT